MPDQGAGQAGRAGVGSYDHPPYPPVAAVVEQSQVGAGAIVGIGDPDMAGGRVDVAAVELCVGAQLLDHEHVDSEADEVVQLAGGQIVEGPIIYGGPAHRAHAIAGRVRTTNTFGAIMAQCREPPPVR